MEEITAQRTEIEQQVKQDLAGYFGDKGINCEGFLLSEVRVVNGQGQEKVLVQEETTIQPANSQLYQEEERRHSVYPPHSNE